ncbi:MAG: TetR/AcrR family transcriptional regulator [Bacteroidia bacterium]|nr:TetR/AcrR family transcriptional regulator [Bacteroidia bacterium]
MRIRDENKEAAIREKAMEMIVKEGFSGMSMQNLAKAANVSPATIYIYFKNREDLLNRLYNEVQQTFTDVALNGFDPELSFTEGLWIQWKNRLCFVIKFPVHYAFYEQFRNSPLVNHSDIQMPAFKENMKQFLTNAVKRGEIRKMDPEIFWSIAYGPFYSLIKFHLEEKSFMNRNFKFTESKMKEAFQLVIKAFR